MIIQSVYHPASQPACQPVPPTRPAAYLPVPPIPTVPTHLVRPVDTGAPAVSDDRYTVDRNRNKNNNCVICQPVVAAAAAAPAAAAAAAAAAAPSASVLLLLPPPAPVVVAAAQLLRQLMVVLSAFQWLPAEVSQTPTAYFIIKKLEFVLCTYSASSSPRVHLSAGCWAGRRGSTPFGSLLFLRLSYHIMKPTEASQASQLAEMMMRIQYGYNCMKMPNMQCIVYHQHHQHSRVIHSDANFIPPRGCSKFEIST